MVDHSSQKKSGNFQRITEKEKLAHISGQSSHAEHINRILFAIADAVNSTEDLGELYKTIHRILGSIIDVTNFFIAIVDRNKRTLYFPYFVDTVDQDFSPLDDFDTESSLTGLVVTEQRSILLKTKELRERDAMNGVWGPSPKIWMGCPLFVREKVIGVVAVQSYTDPDVFDEGDLQLLTAVSHQIALAIDRKRFLDKLRESEQRLAFLIKNSSDSLVIIDADGTPRYINSAIERITGYAIHELEGKTFDTLIHPDDIENLRAAWKEAIKKPEKTVTIHFRHIHKTWGWVFTETILQSFMNEPAIKGLVASIRDITERKEHEQEVFKNEKLRSLGILAGGIAHDFNNVLAAILGNISFAQVFLDPTHKSYNILVEAEKATVRARDLAHQLLTFSRGGEPVKKVISIQRLVRETASLVLRGSNVKAFIEIPDSIHAIEADEGQISQAVHNIIINATQAMPGGGILTISATNETCYDKEEAVLPCVSYIRLAFTDHGCGISDENLKRIFDPYFTTKSTGNGLGLASVHSIVSRHKGHVEVNSVVNQGTTLVIYLPSTGELHENAPNGAAERKTDGHPGGPVLFMDDEKMIRDIASSMLTHLGYEVTTCSCGEEAVALFEKRMQSGTPFLATIMDLTIPGGLGGKEAAEKIISHFPDARLIVSSGYSNSAIMSNYREYGFCGAIAKPFDMHELEKVLGSLLAS